LSKLKCEICPHGCELTEGQTGLCRARGNIGGEIRSLNYGLVTSLSLDPIEKKPLRRFYPGSLILSAGSFGCNFRCSFCQNHAISMADRARSQCAYISPEELTAQAAALRGRGNIGLAFTYNEPLIGYEFVRDCGILAHERELKTVLVTNGFINRAPLEALLPHIDAMNIDLKSFTESFYHKIGGRLETVKQTIALSAPRCHVEVTTLIIPGENDSEEELRALSQWLASVSPDIPLHLSRFFPLYKMTDKEATPKKTIERLAEVARNELRFVYIGNV